MSDRRTKRTEKLIQEAFFELLKTTPADKITVRQICEQADINRSTYYDHYEDYPSFLSKLDDMIVQRYLKTFELYHFDKHTDTLQDTQFDLFKENRNLYSLLFHDEFRHVRERCIREEWNMVRPHWLKHSNVTEEEAEIIYTYMINGMFSVFKYWLDSGCTADEETIKTLMGNVCKYGVYHYIYKKS
jgi:AcrR family transcriptional regulator